MSSTQQELGDQLLKNRQLIAFAKTQSQLEALRAVWATCDPSTLRIFMNELDQINGHTEQYEELDVPNGYEAQEFGNQSANESELEQASESDEEGSDDEDNVKPDPTQFMQMKREAEKQLAEQFRKEAKGRGFSSDKTPLNSVVDKSKCSIRKRMSDGRIKVNYTATLFFTPQKKSRPSDTENTKHNTAQNRSGQLL